MKGHNGFWKGIESDRVPAGEGICIDFPVSMFFTFLSEAPTMKIRRVISLTMFLSFIVMSYTGIMLFVCPQGRVAYWTGWHLFGLSKEQYGALHAAFMVLFLAAGIWHVTLNWRPIVNYLRTRSRKVKVFTREFNVALLLVLAFAVGTLAGVVPWSTLLAWEDSIKAYWERRDGSPPWGHAEENTLARFTWGLVDW
jgi:hypothetical protein